MKKLLLAFVLGVLFILRPASSQQPKGFGDISITNNHTVATNFVSTNLPCLVATLVGLKAGGVSNTAAVYVSPTTNNGQYYVIYPGERHVIRPQAGTRFDLNTWFLRTPTTGDGLYIIFQ